jgi:hypothetical protein
MDDDKLYHAGCKEWQGGPKTIYSFNAHANLRVHVNLQLLYSKLSCNHIFSQLQATYLYHPAVASSDGGQNLSASLAQQGPSDLLVVGYEPAVGMP